MGHSYLSQSTISRSCRGVLGRLRTPSVFPPVFYTLLRLQVKLQTNQVFVYSPFTGIVAHKTKKVTLCLGLGLASGLSKTGIWTGACLYIRRSAPQNCGKCTYSLPSASKPREYVFWSSSTFASIASLIESWFS